MYTREVRETGRLLILSGSGIMTGAELIATTRGMVEDADAVRHVREVLVLLGDVTRLEVDSDHVRQVVEIDRALVKLIPRAAVAIVAPKDEVFGMARMWEMMVVFTEWKIQVFRSREEADLWLESERQVP
ncbi:MAG TPA: hypothetical protein VE981_04355 [Planctomycetota bacterium]|nr:hypothetical protein [Planctomycetota bacterium]